MKDRDSITMNSIFNSKTVPKSKNALRLETQNAFHLQPKKQQTIIITGNGVSDANMSLKPNSVSVQCISWFFFLPKPEASFNFLFLSFFWFWFLWFKSKLARQRQTITQCDDALHGDNICRLVLFPYLLRLCAMHLTGTDYLSHAPRCLSGLFRTLPLFLSYTYNLVVNKKILQIK